MNKISITSILQPYKLLSTYLLHIFHQNHLSQNCSFIIFSDKSYAPSEINNITHIYMTNKDKYYISYFKTSMADNIKIVVRVRPFNANEEGQDNVVEMDDQEVRLRNPEDGEMKKFGFHRCYWSTDNSQGKPAVNNMFVFNDIGKEVLDNIYQGYNATVFAYGQTGSGKSYSIQGYQQKGILQLCLEDIFENKKKQNDQNGISTSVRITYMEIYNEKLRDLVNPKQDTEIKVQSAGNAVFITGVQPVLCQSYAEVQKIFKDGKKIRVIGAHAMNKNSSRSHAVFTIYYKQAGKGKMIQSKFNIVDLAGSERQSKTGATGVRLQEANNINKSLTNLGIVIEALANNCLKKQNNFVPYRNSLLTHILSQSLMGNSKTFMIAAISPASSNYEQTLSTLRFAQRASMITTKTKKNVNAKQGYNKELLQQIQRLKKQLQGATGKTNTVYSHSHSVDVQYITVQDRQRAEQLENRIKMLLNQLNSNKGLLEDLEKQLQEQRKRKLQMEKNRNQALKGAGLSVDTNTEADQNLPYIMNISEDPTLAGMLIYHLKQGQTTIGTKQAEQNTIKLNALGIMKRHCTIIHQKGEIFIEPQPQCRLYVNGLLIQQKRALKHLDRITLGHANTFKLIIPGQQHNDLLTSVAMYGQFLDDRLNADSPQAKNIKIFLQQLKHRIGKDSFARFLQNFRSVYNDIDEANDYTAFRYKKYPLTNRNIYFKINAIIDVENYLKAQPQLIIICHHKETKEVQFIWTQEKFQTRLAEMQTWYSDVSGNQGQSAQSQFDPWFDATDQFIKEKQQLESLNAKKLHDFWNKKQTQNTQRYKTLLAEQKQILSKLNQAGANADLVQQYADFYFRNYDISEKNKKKVEAMRKNQKVHNIIKRFMECCAQIQKCNIDNKVFNEHKMKYDQTKEKKKSNMMQQEPVTGGVGGGNMNEILSENAWLNQKLEVLQNQIKKQAQQIKRLKDSAKK